MSFFSVIRQAAGPLAGVSSGGDGGQGVINHIRDVMAQKGAAPTAQPATPGAMQPQQAIQPWGGFTMANIGQYGYGTDLNPLSQQTGIPRDTLADQRDAFIRPIESSYRTQMEGQGGRADATSANLVGSPGFQQFAQGGQTIGSLGTGTGPATSQYGFGSALAPWTGQFNAPTAQEAVGTPGLQYALSRAQQAIERSAAAKGTLLTGGTLRDLSENQIGMALQGYQGAFDRSKDVYNMGKSTFYENQDRPFQKLLSLGELGRPT